MGAQADHDLWGQVMSVERQFGDRGPDIVATKAQVLRRAGEFSEADFWMQVAECLTDLHAIKFDGADKEQDDSARRRSPQTHRAASTPRTASSRASDLAR